MSFEQARFVRDRLQEMLLHSAERVKQRMREEGPSPGLQWAVRILESRARVQERLFVRLYGSAQERQIAAWELTLDTDDGGLLELDGKKHGRGRFDCHACYRVPGDETQTALSFIRICTGCGKGLEHVEFQLIDPATHQYRPWASLTVEEADKLLADGHSRLHYRCETCNREVFELYSQPS